MDNQDYWDGKERRKPSPDMEHQRTIEMFKSQLLLAVIRRLSINNKWSISVDEIDRTGEYILDMDVDQANRRFHFQITKKN